MNTRDRIESVLPRVTNPGQYIGGEWNVRPPREDRTAVRVALVHPQPYLRAANDLALQTVYHLLNELPGVSAERAFAPCPDMEERLRHEQLPLLCLESHRVPCAFDLVVAFLADEEDLPTFANLLDLASIPVLARDREERHPPIVGLGRALANPAPSASILDLAILGEPEEVLPALVTAIAAQRGLDLGRSERIASLRREVPGVVSATRDGARVRLPWVEDLDASPVATAPVVPYVRTEGEGIVIEILRSGPNDDGLLPPGGTSGPPPRRRSLSRIVEIAGEIVRSTGYDQIELRGPVGAEDPGFAPLVDRLEKVIPAPHGALSLPLLPVSEWTRDLVPRLARWPGARLRLAVVAGTERLREALGRPCRDSEIVDLAAHALASDVGRIELRFLLGAPGETLEDAEAIANIVRAVQRVRKRFAHGRGRLQVNVACFSPLPYTRFERRPMKCRDALVERIERIRALAGSDAASLDIEPPERACLRTAFARSGGELGGAILRAWRAGHRTGDGSTASRAEIWKEALEAQGVDPWEIATRTLADDEPLPWGDAAFDTGAPCPRGAKDPSNARNLATRSGP